MKESDFVFFLELLRSLEKRHLAGATIETTIIELLDQFSYQLTAEQRQLLMKEFLSYEEKRETRRDERRASIEHERRDRFESEGFF